MREKPVYTGFHKAGATMVTMKRRRESWIMQNRSDVLANGDDMRVPETGAKIYGDIVCVTDDLCLYLTCLR